MVEEARALVAPEVGAPLQLQRIILDKPRRDEAIVEIHAVGICHADLACMDGKLPARFPSVFGHEGIGIVREVGQDIRNVQPLDTVILSYNSCGDCTQCRSNCPAYCIHMLHLNFGGTRLDGTTTLRSHDGSLLYGSFFGQSSFSSLALVNGRCLVKVLPQSISRTAMELYAPLGCGIQTGVGAVWNTLNVQPQSTVVIFGTGSVGMAAVMAARIREAKAIIGVDIHQGRLELAQRIGATHVINSSSNNTNNTNSVSEAVRSICNGQGVMFALDTTGIPAVIEEMISVLGIRGRAATIGAPAPGSMAKVDILNHLIMGRSYVGSNQGDAVPQEMIPQLIAHHEAGRLPLQQIVSFYDVEDYRQAFEDMRSGAVIKPVLVWRKGE